MQKRGPYLPRGTKDSSYTEESRYSDPGMLKPPLKGWLGGVCEYELNGWESWGSWAVPERTARYTREDPQTPPLDLHTTHRANLHLLPIMPCSH